MNREQSKQSHDQQLKPESHFVLSKTAKLRLTQLNLTESNIHFVITHGQAIHRTGIVFFFLGRNNIPVELRKKFIRLEGTFALVDPLDFTVITVCRNRKGLSNIKRKTKFSTGGPYRQWKMMLAIRNNQLPSRNKNG